MNLGDPGRVSEAKIITIGYTFPESKGQVGNDGERDKPPTYLDLWIATRGNKLRRIVCWFHRFPLDEKF